VEQRRRQRLIEFLEHARRHRTVARVVIPVQPMSGKVTDLPAGIWLQPRCLKVDFHGAEDLLSKLYALAQVAARDFDVFRMAVESGGAATAASPATTSPTTPTAGSAGCW
jgi:hypothetical protein